ncbi:hypothetical protein PR048_006619 [Dryococelus australis]|uniref:Tyrosinase copper-binding domain-containing protein n=1 Tax=Dryococelus australis TaxID=614101 RepID=A0ABQ9IBH9_9NEOP|nr:hypothetical protein PR048_006619 [Dryococelus australis]
MHCRCGGAQGSGFESQQPTVIPMKFTGSINNPEQRVAYFGEDIGMNSHHSHWHMDFPFWWKKDYSGDKDRKGELFFYMHHQMVARFDAERLSNNLPVVAPLDFDERIVEGFAPGAMYDNGQEFPVRPDGVMFRDLPWRTIHEMKLYEGRIRDAIAAGFIRSYDGVAHLNNSRGINLLGEIVESSEHSLNREYYGQLHNDAHVLLSKVTDPQLKFGVPPGVMEHFETATRDPAFFRLHKTIDNLFKLHKDLLSPYTREQLDFPGVRVEAIKVVGLSKASTPNTLITYFDESHIDMANAVEGSGTSGVDIRMQASGAARTGQVLVARLDDPTAGQVVLLGVISRCCKASCKATPRRITTAAANRTCIHVIPGRYTRLRGTALIGHERVSRYPYSARITAAGCAVVSRLNHEPFKYVLTINSARQTTGVARIFLSPKYDWFGKQIPYNTLRWGVIELDRFPISLTVGDNVISRNSEDSVVTIAEPRSFPELLKDVQEALKGNDEFVVDKVSPPPPALLPAVLRIVDERFYVCWQQLRHCGFPHRLLLPKGKPEGMTYRLLVTITDFQQDVVSTQPTD